MSKLYIIITLSLTLFQSFLFSQTSIESLEFKLNYVDGRDKLSILQKLTEANLILAPEKSIKYALDGIQLAKYLDDKNSEYLFTKLAANAFYELGNYYKSLNYLLMSLKLIEQLGDKAEMSDVLNNIGITYKNLGFIDNSIEYFQKSLTIRELLGDKIGIAGIYHNLGNLYLIKNDYQSALNNFLKSLEIKEIIGDKESLSNTYNSLGITYSYLKNFNKSLEFYNKTLKIKEEIGDKKSAARILINIGTIFKSRNDFNNAIQYYEKALNISQKDNDEELIAKAYNNIGNCYDALGEYAKSLNFYEKSLDLHEKLGNSKDIAITIMNIGSIYTKLGKYDKAFQYLNRSLNYSNEKGFRDVVAANYYSFAIYYTAIGKQKISDEYYQMYVNLKDSLLNEETNRRIAEMQVKYDTEKKIKENELLRRENEAKAIQIENETKFRTFWFFISGLILISTFAIYKLYLNKKKTNVMLELKNRELEIANLKLSESEKRLLEANTTKDKFLYIIAHDLRNTLTVMLTSTDFISLYADKLDIEKIRQHLKKLKLSSTNLRDLLENLLNWALSESGKTEFNPEYISARSVVDNVLKALDIFIDNKSIIATNKINPDLMIFADRNMITTTFRNLITNAVKFTNNGGFIEIDAVNQGEFVQFSIKDNGVGISPKDLNKLFKYDTHFTTLGTNHEKGTGLGLMICREFIERHGGRIWVESEFGKGSNFKFLLPQKLQNRLN
ncbi:MAG: tetratricopeptide repeat-containing sensor histidine kinase [Candidatus Kapabacteria bacterium]|nr:tetratricopeptide repeat-containing sensor histidine kinase [Candidatus Kapabacteria bacterium]